MLDLACVGFVIIGNCLSRREIDLRQIFELFRVITFLRFSIAGDINMPNEGIGDRFALQTSAELSAANQPIGSYPRVISVLNPLFQRVGIDISSRQQANMIQSMQAVSQGKMTNAQASTSEGSAFLSDAFDSSHPLKYRLSALVGGVVNKTIAPAAFAQIDMENSRNGVGQDDRTRFLMYALRSLDPIE